MKKEKLKTVGNVKVDLIGFQKYLHSQETLKEYADFISSKDNLFYSYFEDFREDFDKDKLFVEFNRNGYVKKYYLSNHKKFGWLKSFTELKNEFVLSLHSEEADFALVMVPDREAELVYIPKKVIVSETRYDGFSNLSIGEVLKLKTVQTASDEVIQNSLADVSNKSKVELEHTLESQKLKVKEEEEKLELEIKKLKEKMELEISKMKESIADKMKPVVLNIENLTDKLHAFENQVYSVMSFLGMTFEIEQIAKGKRATLEEPLVIWQKLRYLDEELPKLQTIYDVDFSDRKIFEKLLVENEIVRDYFLPNEKSITVLKVSKTGIRYSYQSAQRNIERHEVGKVPWTDFTLGATSLLHGHRSALLMRDGENIYIAWTEEDKIKVNDDNLFYTDQTGEFEIVDVKYEEESDLDKWHESSRGSQALRNLDIVRDNFAHRRELMNIPMSRVYLKSIIEGLLERGDILRVPVREDISEAINNKAKYIKFRTADFALKDTRFGTMDDLRKLSESGNPRVGEDIYISIKDNSESRDRGGRGRDAYLTPGLDRINYIEYNWTFYATLSITEDMIEEVTIPAWAHHEERKEWQLKPEFKKIKDGMRVSLDYDGSNRKESWLKAYFKVALYSETNYSPDTPALPEKYHEAVLDESLRWNDERTLREIGFKFDPKITKSRRSIYVSAEKSWSYSGKARANIEIYQGEYINLTFWNTVWLSYAIRNHHTFSRMFENHFATQLPHMQDMLNFLQERESNFRKLILKHLDSDLPNEWQVDLSHWMIEKDYRNFSEFRAKQFVKYLKENKKV